MPDNGSPDKLDSAIAAANQPSVVMEQLNVTISSTGRPFMCAIPRDMTDAELAEVMGWLGTAVLNHLRAARAKTAGGRIVLPT